jgi:hypothetical protein
VYVCGTRCTCAGLYDIIICGETASELECRLPHARTAPNIVLRPTPSRELVTVGAVTNLNLNAMLGSPGRSESVPVALVAGRGPGCQPEWSGTVTSDITDDVRVIPVRIHSAADSEHWDCDDRVLLDGS